MMSEGPATLGGVKRCDQLKAACDAYWRDKADHRAERLERCERLVERLGYVLCAELEIDPESEDVYFFASEERHPVPQPVEFALQELERCRYTICIGVRIRGREENAAVSGVVWGPLTISMLDSQRYEIGFSLPESRFTVEVDSSDEATLKRFADAMIDAMLEMFDVGTERASSVRGFTPLR